MRKVFGSALKTLADNDDKILLLIGDNGYGLFNDFIEKYPNRFFNVGICEQSMVGIASGMALQGFKPYVYTISPFLFERAFEQVKLDIDQQNVNVKLIGYGDYPEQGPTHNLILTKEICDKMFINIKTYEPETRVQVIDSISESYTNKYPTIILLKKLRDA
jgi:transketolase